MRLAIILSDPYGVEEVVMWGSRNVIAEETGGSGGGFPVRLLCIRGDARTEFRWRLLNATAASSPASL